METPDFLEKLNQFPLAIPLLASLFGLLGYLKVFIPDEESLNKKVSFLKENHLQKIISRNYASLLSSAINTYDPNSLSNPESSDLIGDFVKTNYKALFFLFDLRNISGKIEKSYTYLFYSFILAIIFSILTLFFSKLGTFIGLFAAMIIFFQIYHFIKIRRIEENIKKHEQEYL